MRPCLVVEGLEVACPIDREQCLVKMNVFCCSFLRNTEYMIIKLKAPYRHLWRTSLKEKAVLTMAERKKTEVSGQPPYILKGTCRQLRMRSSTNKYADSSRTLFSASFPA